MKRSIFIIALAVIAALTGAQAKKMSDLKIYINPGHGGYTSDDRNIVIYPFSQGDSLGFWESKSNLYKGLHLYHILDSLGATPMLSRTKNTQDDDRSLSSISAEANAFGADYFLSIHSNAGETTNYLLMLYREQTYGVPRYEENVTLSNIVAENLYENEMTLWTRSPRVCGDIKFYQDAGMWNTGLGVLRQLYTIGLLSEGGMHEHRPECYRLMNDDYWWLEAWHFARSIMDYFDTEDRFVTGNVAGVVWDDHNDRTLDIPHVSFTMHGRDNYAPVCGCLIELLDQQGNVVQKRTTDNLYNGVFVFRNVTPGNYKVRYSKDTYYTEEQDITVEADKVTYCNQSMNMRREFPLEITVTSPMPKDDGFTNPGDPITLVFNTDVDEESLQAAFTLTPEINGYWKFSDNNHTAQFIPKTVFDQDTEYTMVISTDAKHADTHYANGHLQEPLTYTFTTAHRGYLEVTDHYPVDGGYVHYQSPTVELRFDNSIKSSGLTNYVTIADSKGNKMNLNNRNCSYNTVSNGLGNAVFAVQGDLDLTETYTFQLTTDIRDTDNLTMENSLSFTFRPTDVTAQAELPVIETFDASTVISGNLDESTGVATKPSVAKSTSPRLFGDAAVKLSYSFADTHDGIAYWDYAAETPQGLEKGDKLGFYVNGDFSNHELWAGVTAGTDTKWVKVCDLNFRGWEFHEVVLDELEESNAQMEFIYTLDRFRIVQVESPVTLKSSIVLDNIVYSDEHSGVGSIVADGGKGSMKVYPVPASDRIFVEGLEDIAKLELLNIDGSTVGRSAGTSISVSGLSTGVYLLRVTTTNGSQAVTRVLVTQH